MNPATQAAIVAATSSKQTNFSPEEWQTRVDLAACYRLVALYGWTDLVFTHVTAKIPGTDNQFLINPYGMLFDEITASSLVKIDLAGNKLDDSPYPVNPAGFVIHSAIHAARADAKCVLHTHTANGVAVAAQKSGVLPISQQSIFVLASLAYHDYEGVALNDDEKPRLVRDIGNKHFLMLKSHGLLTVGESIADAFLYMYIFETTCNIQIRAQSTGGELIRVPQPILDGAVAQMAAGTKGLGGQIAWPALLRKLDRIAPDYKS
ncbi:MAG: class II aldolase/adducin family protein [Burkholderiales bacterium]|nr:class II aldolase/adducin family protein [Burkholderiales bacterium]